jgi:hypothetical protein
MTTSVSRRLNILCIMFKIIVFLVIALLPGCVRVGILLPSVERPYMTTSFHQEGEASANKTSLTWSLNQASKMSVHVCALGASILPRNNSKINRINRRKIPLTHKYMTAHFLGLVQALK